MMARVTVVLTESDGSQTLYEGYPTSWRLDVAQDRLDVTRFGGPREFLPGPIETTLDLSMQLTQAVRRNVRSSPSNEQTLPRQTPKNGDGAVPERAIDLANV